MVTNYVYNSFGGALSDIERPTAPAYNVHLTYDNYGRVTGRADSAGTYSWAYGNVDEVTNVTTAYTGLPARAVSYTYHPDGSRATMGTPAGVFAYAYDGAGRPQSLSSPYAGTATWSYLANDWLNTQTLNNNVTTTYTHNTLGQLIALVNTLAVGGGTGGGGGPAVLSEFTNLLHDGAGNRVSVTANLPTLPSHSGITGYAYNDKEELLQEQSTRLGGYTLGFAYDGVGNLTSFKGQTRSYNNKNQLTGGGGLGGSFVYDGNGNPTTYNGSSVLYDPNNNPVAFGSQMTAGYRSDGLRAWKQSTSTGVRTYFLYDGLAPVAEMDAAGVVTAVNTWGPTGLLSRWTAASGSVFYTFDERGNTVQRTDGSGAVLSTHITDSYGSTTSSAPTGNDPYAGFGGQLGYYTDVETGLSLCTWRYYDAGVGRWLNRDPIGYAGGLNLYAYCGGNPVMGSDPLGLCDNGGGHPSGAPSQEAFNSLFGAWDARNNGPTWTGFSGDPGTDAALNAADGYAANMGPALAAGRSAAAGRGRQVAARPVPGAPPPVVGGEGEGESFTTAGRWMSKIEYQKMVDTGRVQPSRSADGQDMSWGTVPPYSGGFKNMSKGSVFAVWEMPEPPKQWYPQGGGSGRLSAIFFGPNSIKGRIEARRGVQLDGMPKIQNLRIEIDLEDKGQ